MEISGHALEINSLMMTAYKVQGCVCVHFCLKEIFYNAGKNYLLRMCNGLSLGLLSVFTFILTAA